MGKLPGGIDYDMIGKTGNHVGRRVKGENIISMAPAKSNRPPSPLQYDQRLKFGLITGWVRSLLPILNIGYQHYQAEMSAFNKAVSENIKYAVTGVTPNYTVDYPLARFSKGVLRPITDAQVENGTGAVLDFSWTSVVGQGYAAATDQVAVIAYSVVKDEFVALMNAAVRSAQEYALTLPADWVGDQVQTWVLVVSADGKLVSDTSFAGALTVI